MTAGRRLLFTVESEADALSILELLRNYHQACFVGRANRRPGSLSVHRQLLALTRAASGPLLLFRHDEREDKAPTTSGPAPATAALVECKVLPPQPVRFERRKVGVATHPRATLGDRKCRVLRIVP